MNEKLIKELNEIVDENDFVLHKYKNVNGKNKWNCICSAMDWITVSTHYLCSDRVLNITSDKDINSIEVYTFISCIDLLWESIQQLHRVFFDISTIPFQNQRNIFSNNQFSMNDNDYFKTIRACFGAHPVNLNDKFNGDEKERRFASWSGPFGDQGEFSVRLYPSNTADKDILLDIKLEELWNFAEERYGYLKHLIDTIKNQEIEYVEEMRAINFPGASPQMSTGHLPPAILAGAGY